MTLEEIKQHNEKIDSLMGEFRDYMISTIELYKKEGYSRKQVISILHLAFLPLNTLQSQKLSIPAHIIEECTKLVDKEFKE